MNRDHCMKCGPVSPNECYMAIGNVKRHNHPCDGQIMSEPVTQELLPCPLPACGGEARYHRERDSDAMLEQDIQDCIETIRNPSLSYLDAEKRDAYIEADKLLTRCLTHIQGKK